jgi:DNA repair protein RecO (recombination protein O)
VGTGRLYRTEGIVVHRRDQGEADRVLTLCTPSGKTSVIAKGVRKVRSRKAGHVELFACSSFVLSRVQNSWDIISQAEVISPHPRLGSDLLRGAYARYAVEVFDGFFAEEEGGPALYDLLQNTLTWLSEHDDLDLIVRFYEQHLLGLAGFRPELFRCVGDHAQPLPLRPDEHKRDGRPFGLDAERGGVLCYDCYVKMRADYGILALSPHVLLLLRGLQRGPYTRMLGKPIPPGVHADAERVMHHYITHHLERSVRSVFFLHQLRRGGAGSADLPPSVNPAEL